MSSKTSAQPRRRGRSIFRFLGLLFLVVLLALGVLGLWFWNQLENSLPTLDGELTLDGSSAPVSVERDSHGVPTIRAENRVDLARAVGFVHGQDRFFQMDLIRRKSAGELAELVGPAALRLDRRARLHRFRARARETVEEHLPSEDVELIRAYTAGVNAGLASLDARPFEYIVLRTEPRPWSAEDTLLAVYAMYIDLQGGLGAFESTYGLMADLLPPELYTFLTPRGTEWDAPLLGEKMAVAPIPGPEIVDLRGERGATGPDEAGTELDEAADLSLSDELPDGPWLAAASLAEIGGPRAEGMAPGSNNWAVAGSRSRHGGALLADDMHLGLGVPNIWYRASLIYPDPANPGQDLRITGVTLPGAMVVVAGSNGTVAWGFTNSTGDWADLVELEPVPGDENAYMTPEGPEPFERHEEVLRTSSGQEETLEILSTRWGPVWDTDHQGRRRALRWVAHDPRAANLKLRDLETVRTIDEAIALASRIGAPSQNFVTVDTSGRIGWTLMGLIPRRFGHDGRVPSSWADGTRGWDGWLETSEYPRVVDPESGHLWTANTRVVGGEDYAKIGDGGYDLGARASQIRDGLLALETADEKDLLAIQLDDRALFLERWKDLLQTVLSPMATEGNPNRARMRETVDAWEGRAGVDSASYLLVRSFRLGVKNRVFEALTAPCRAADPDFRSFRLAFQEGPLWSLVQERPRHLLPPEHESWDDLLLAAADAAHDELLVPGDPPRLRTWGEENRSRISHPLSFALPFLSPYLDMPAEPLPGDANMPRVQARGFGASERFVVSPGRESEGIFHMPGGQSGHPLSDFYRAGHRDWMTGKATGFLPGEPLHTLRLVPGT